VPRPHCWSFGNKIEKGYQMKLLDTAKLEDIARYIFLGTVFAHMAQLCIHFILHYLSIAVIAAFYLSAFYYCPNARKRVTGRIAHQRRFALFKINPDSRAGLSGR